MCVSSCSGLCCWHMSQWCWLAACLTAWNTSSCDVVSSTSNRIVCNCPGGYSGVLSPSFFAGAPADTVMLDFNSGNITTVLPGSFDMFPFLRLLDMSNNDITSIPSSLFTSPFLTDIVLTNNQISSISTSAFVGLPLLVRIYLGNNRLTSANFSNLDTIYLHLQDNKIRTVQIANSSIQYLRLDNNPVNSLTRQSLVNLSSLYFLSIKSSNLTSIESGIFLCCPILSEIYLSFLGVIPPGVFANLPVLRQLELSNVTECHSLSTRLP